MPAHGDKYFMSQVPRPGNGPVVFTVHLSHRVEMNPAPGSSTYDTIKAAKVGQNVRWGQVVRAYDLQGRAAVVVWVFGLSGSGAGVY